MLLLVLLNSEKINPNIWIYRRNWDGEEMVLNDIEW
jgi:hypothetical protein